MSNKVSFKEFKSNILDEYHTTSGCQETKEDFLLEKLYYNHLSNMTMTKDLAQLLSKPNLPIEGIWSFVDYMSSWTWHNSGYYFKSKDHNQWPPDQTATKEELIKSFFGILTKYK